jgi:hypothetical protein
MLKRSKEMKCAKCQTKQANIVIIDKDGNFYEDNAFCCWCFVEDFKDKILNVMNIPAINNIN